MAERRCLQQVEILKNENVAFLSLHSGKSLPPAGRNPHSLKVLDLLSLYGRQFGVPLGRLWVIWGHAGATLESLWVGMGRVWDLGTFQGHFGDLNVPEYRFS